MVHSNRGDRVYARWQALVRMPNGRSFKCKTTAVNSSSIYFESPISIPIKTNLSATLIVLDNKRFINLDVQGKVKTCFLASQGEYFIINLSLENASSEAKNFINKHFQNLSRFKPRFNR